MFCKACKARGYCKLKISNCENFDPDMDVVAQIMVEQTVRALGPGFSTASVTWTFDKLEIRVPVVALPEQATQHLYLSQVATALTAMNEEHLCLPDGLGLNLLFEAPEVQDGPAF